MNLSLTMSFDSISELQEFLNRNPGARDTPVATIAPDIVEQTVTADPLELVVDSPSKGELLDDTDYVALRSEIMATLQAKAGAMEEPSILGAFITGFGVKKFSELDDDMLLPFKAAFTEEFGA